MAEGSMKVMKHKWCWIGLVICASSTAWAAKHNDDKSGSDTKKGSSAEADSQDDATKDDATKDDATKDDATKDDTADEDVTPKPPPKKVGKKAKTAGPPPKRTSTLNMGLLGSFGASPLTRWGLGLRGGLTLGPTEGLYVGDNRHFLCRYLCDAGTANFSAQRGTNAQCHHRWRRSWLRRTGLNRFLGSPLPVSWDRVRGRQDLRDRRMLK